MNNILLEILQHEAKTLSEKTGKKGKIVRALVKWQAADEINANRRLYPMSTLQREAQKIQDKIDKGNTVWGHAYHPADAQGRTVDISHRWDKVWSKGKNFYGEITILPTQHGKMIQELVKHGKLSMSSRGTGTTTEKSQGEKKYVEVNKDFDLKTPGDFVISGSVEGAELIKVIESQKVENLLTEEKIEELEEMLEEDKTKKKITDEEFLAEVTTLLEIGFARDDEKDWNRYVDTNTERAVRIVKKEHEDKGHDLSEVFTEEEPEQDLQLKERQKLSALYRDAQRGGFRGAFAEWLVKYQKVVEVKPIGQKSLTEEETEKKKKAREIQERVRWNLIAGKSK